jgi:MATE family multidrug resistance protein
VGFWLGAGQAKNAEKAAHTGLQLSLVLALLCSGFLGIFRVPLSHLFSANLEVAVAAAGVLAWVAFYHLVDALQAVCAFILRCYRITLLPLVIYSVMLWGIGLGGAYLWAYQGLGVVVARPEVSTFWAASSMALLGVTAAFVSLVLWVAKQRRL